MLDPTLLDGPLMPEEFAALASLDASQESRYATLYQNLMGNTRSDRAAVQAARDKRRQQMTGGGQVDREAMRSERERLRPMYEKLQKEQETFDEALKDFLKPDQLKKYEEWKAAKREELRARFGGRQGRRSP
jgi:Spy/CpxP family protein refolding chaperone